MKTSDKVILDLCGGTGAWSKPYADAGYDVRVITLPEHDVRDIVVQNLPDIYGVLASPPCTHFSGSGAQYWTTKDENGRTADHLSIVDACWEIIDYTQPVFWCLENPVGRLKKLRQHLLGDIKMYFNPCDYGDPYTKKTCLWGNFNRPVKTPVDPIKVCGQGSWLMKLGGKSERTKRLRSITPAGFAKAFFEANR